MDAVRSAPTQPAGCRRGVVLPDRLHARPRLTAGVVSLAVALVLIILLPLAIAGPVAIACAVTTAYLGRRVLADLLAGGTLLLARPYAAGERLRLRIDGAPVEAELLQVRLLRTSLCTGDGVLVLRNSDLLRV